MLFLIPILALFGVLGEHFPKPTILIEEGRVIDQALHEERISRRDVFDAMKKSGIVTLDDVRWAVLQSDGSIAIIPAERQPHQSGSIMHGAHRGG